MIFLLISYKLIDPFLRFMASAQDILHQIPIFFISLLHFSGSGGLEEALLYYSVSQKSAINIVFIC